MEKNNTFEAWALVELFGHTKIAGKVSEQQIAGSSFVRVDVPKTSTQPEFTRTFNPSAVYAFNWCTEEMVNMYAERIDEKPVTVYDIREAATLLLNSENESS